MKKYRALDVANYVITYSLKTNKIINHIQLQKILYYLYATYLYMYNKALFNDKIEKWKLGAVVPSVYDEYKGFGTRDIHFLLNETTFNFETFKIEKITFDEMVLDKEIKEWIETKVEHLLTIDGLEMVRMIQSHDIWLKDKDKINNDKETEKIQYTLKEIQEFFINNPNYLSDLKLI